MKLLTVFFLLAIILPASATSLRPLTLEQLSSRATLIFHAEVVNNEVREDLQSSQVVTLTTFRVLELIKGQVNGEDGRTHTIKQLGGTMAGGRQRLMVHGIPDFVPGRQYVLFLPAPSRLGFSSPLGLHQGSFTVSEKNGTKFVSNGHVLNSNPNSVPAEAGQGSHSLPLAVTPDRQTQATLRNFMDTLRSLQQSPLP